MRSSYAARIHRVIDHIDAHLDAPLDLHALAEVAHFSPWHFHRLFQAFTGETLADRVRRRRLETAALRLLASPRVTALSIALDVGFGSAEVFSRAFRSHFGVTPSAWRRGASRDWANARRSELGKIHQAGRNARQALADAFRDDELDRQSSRANAEEGTPMQVRITTFPEVRVAYMRHLGPYASPGIGQLWMRFDAWLTEQRLTTRELFGITPDSPDITPPEKCRYDACVQVDAAFKPGGEINLQSIAGGLYACVPFTGNADAIHRAWMRLYGEWLPESGYQADDRPAIEAYGTAIKQDPATGAFSCELRLPVKAAAA